jgi:hypothetical protein
VAIEPAAKRFGRTVVERRGGCHFPADASISLWQATSGEHLTTLWPRFTPASNDRRLVAQ